MKRKIEGENDYTPVFWIANIVPTLSYNKRLVIAMKGKTIRPKTITSPRVSESVTPRD